jgi:hypothetical protein
MKKVFPKFRSLTVLVAVLAGMGMVALAADVTGVWTASFDTQIGEQHYTYTLKADAEKLTGTAKNDRGETQIEDGVVKDSDISFTENLEFQGQKIAIKYKGKVDGDQINLTREVGEFATETFVAKGQK